MAIIAASNIHNGDRIEVVHNGQSVTAVVESRDKSAQRVTIRARCEKTNSEITIYAAPNAYFKQVMKVVR